MIPPNTAILELMLASFQSDSPAKLAGIYSLPPPEASRTAFLRSGGRSGIVQARDWHRKGIMIMNGTRAGRTMNMLAGLGLLAVLCSLAPAAEQAEDQPSPARTNLPSARDLVASVANGRKTSGFRMRATLSRSVSPTRKDETRQLAVRGRFDGKSGSVVYVCLSPPIPEGQAVLIVRREDGAAEVSVLTSPDRLTAMPPDRFGERLFGTDFTIADMVESFWSWPAAMGHGRTNLLGHSCLPVEFRRPLDDDASGSLVRAWIAPDISLPLLVEVFDGSGAAIRRLHSEKLIRRAGDYWAPMFVIAEDPATGSKTTLAIRGGDRNLDVPAEDFTPSGIAGIIAGKEKKENPGEALAPPETP